MENNIVYKGFPYSVVGKIINGRRKYFLYHNVYKRFKNNFKSTYYLEKAVKEARLVNKSYMENKRGYTK